MTIEDEEAFAARYRRLLEDRLLNMHADNGTASSSIYALSADLEPAKVMRARRAMVEHLSDLTRAGVVAFSDGGDGISPTWLTAFGRRVLEKKEPSPHDESGFLAAIRNRVAAPDEIVLTYVAEAAAAWRAHLDRSSAVMIGCACERVVLLLAEDISQKNHSPYDAKLRKALADGAPISTVFAFVRDALETMTLPNSLKDSLHRTLSAIFDSTRRLRNKAGHPSSQDVSHEEAHASLLTFRDFYSYVEGLRAEIAKLKRATD